MKINVSYNQYATLLDEFRQKRWITVHQDGKTSRTDWHSPFIAGQNHFFNLRPDLKIYDWNQTFLERLELFEPGLESHPAILIFLLKGHLQATHRDSTYYCETQVKAGYNLLMLNGLGKQGTWICPYGLASQTVEVIVDPRILATYLDHESLTALVKLRQRLSEYLDQPYFHMGAITPEMQMVLHQYLHCPYEGIMQTLYLESKAVELIVLKLAQIKQMAQEADTRNTNGTKRQLNSQDLERVYQAREILLSDMVNPPSLQQLAGRVGIGDYKLKQDFRTAFGKTVFGYLRSHRLEQARQLLTTRTMNVSEVPQFVGYGSLSKFTAAFKRQFGVLPSTIGKR
ncbi:AraC family transcriptional regulator [Leptothoe sp. LEGE 181152]|nr:AraC family transcriptional regulator [Leptothoe sp. LEGE 181152]